MSSIIVLLFDGEPQNSEPLVIVIFVERVQVLGVVVNGYMTSVPLVPTHFG